MPLDDSDLSRLIRDHATYHAAPEALRERLRALSVAAVSAPDAPPQAPVARPARRRWPIAAASFAVGVACTVIVLPALQRLDLGDSPQAELVADHVHALQTGASTEVASSDHHTVKPWFQGRLDYAPPVIDLAPLGFPLAGARLEHLHGQAVATLVYTHNGHVIDVYVWPSEARRAPEHDVRRGFELVHWADGAMQVWAVSDLERSELERFAQAWRDHAAAR